VNPGHYLVTAQWQDGAGGTSDISKGVLVTGRSQGEGTVTAQPNILKVFNGQTVTTFKSNSTQSLTLDVKIYNVAGELVTALQGQPGTNQALWDASEMASGIYVVLAEQKDLNGNLLTRQFLKVVVLR